MDTARCDANIVDDDEGPTREQLDELTKAMFRDWVRLNEFLIATANRYHWCPEFEKRLDAYNDTFEVLKLKGRSREIMEAYRANQPDPFPITTTLASRIIEIVAEWRLPAIDFDATYTVMLQSSLVEGSDG